MSAFFTRRNVLRSVVLAALGSRLAISGARSAARAGDSCGWILDQLNGAWTGLTPPDLTPRFSPLFLSGLNESGIIATFAALSPVLAPVSIARPEGGVTDQHAHALLKTANGFWRLRLGLEQEQPHRIDDFFLEPVSLPVPPERPRSWAGINSRFRSIAPMASYFAAEIRDGELTPIASYHADISLPVASSFKLYVLGAIARQIAAGPLTWDTRLTIRDDLRSLPSGDLRYREAGTTLPIEFVAEQMICQSDNTATDHLIAVAGREQVEQMLGLMGHHDPAANIPLLNTREWFAMRMRLDSDQISAYLAASVPERRRILQQEIDPIARTLTEDEPWPGPAESNRLEWFASAEDLGRAIAWLQPYVASGEMAPVANALSLNPGVPYPPDDWQYVGFKEGYETGLKAMSWLLQRRDGRWFTLIGIIHDERQEINGAGLKTLMDAAVTLLARRD